MIHLLILLVAGFVGYKFGKDAGRGQLCEAQRQQLVAALSSENLFYANHNLHGLYSLAGHGERLGAGFVVVKFDELQALLTAARAAAAAAGSDAA